MVQKYFGKLKIVLNSTFLLYYYHHVHRRRHHHQLTRYCIVIPMCCIDTTSTKAMRKGFSSWVFCVCFYTTEFSRELVVWCSDYGDEGETESLRAHYTIAYIVYIYVYNICYYVIYYVITCVGTLSSLDTSSEYDHEYRWHTALDVFFILFYFCFITLLKKPLSPFWSIFFHYHLSVIITRYAYSCFPEWRDAYNLINEYLDKNVCIFITSR